MVGVLSSFASGSFRRPWTAWRRGLFIAALLSVLVHGITFNALNQSFDFKFNERRGTASLNTRVIEPASEKETGVQPRSPSQPANKLEKAATTPVAVQPARPSPREAQPVNPAQTEQAAVMPDDTSQLNQDMPVAAKNVAPLAPEMVSDVVPHLQTEAEQGGAANQLSLQYPPNAQLEFEVLNVRRGQSRVGNGQLNWRSNGGEYFLELESTLLGLAAFTQSSTGAIDAMGLAPERYSDKRFNRSEQAAHFDRARGVVKFSNNKPDAPLLPGIQDRVSVLLQLAGIIGGDPQTL